MQYLDKIPYLKLYLQKVYLPIKKDEPMKHNVVFLNTKTKDGSINAINNTYIYHNNKYKSYMLNSYYQGKLMTKTYRVNYRTKIKDEYKDLTTKLSGFRLIKDISTLNEKNLYYDMRVYNDLFFKFTKGKPYMQRIDTYLSYMKSIIDKVEFKDYNKLILISIDDWITKDDMKNIEKKKYSITNLIFILYFLMKYDIDKFKSIGNIDIVFHYDGKTFKINPSLCDKDTYKVFKILLNKLVKNLVPEEEVEENKLIDTEDVKTEIKNQVRIASDYLTGKAPKVDDNIAPKEKEELSSKKMNGIYPVSREDSTNPYFVKWFFKTKDFEGDDPTKFNYDLTTHTGTDRYVYGYFINSKLEGFITVSPRKDKYEIGMFYVNPDKAGKGIGQKLFNYIIDNFGNKKLALDVFSWNEKAIHVYEKYGFKKVDEFKYTKAMSGGDNKYVGDTLLVMTREPINSNKGFPVKEEAPEEIDANEIEDKATEKIETIIDDKIDSIPEDKLSEDEIANLSSEIINNKQFISQISKHNKELAMDTTNKNSRDYKLRQEVNKLKFDNMTVEEVYEKAEKASKATLSSNDVSKVIHTPNKNMKNVRYTDFDKKYIEEVMDKDYLEVFRCLEDKSIGMTIISYSKEDTSDEFNYKETLHVKLEDTNRVRHSITVDIPKIIDNRYIFIGGNKKIIYKQKFPFPITKTSPDIVQICTNYNKIFIDRYGLRVTADIEKFNGLINNKDLALPVVRGNNTSNNRDYITSFEYDEIAKKISKLSVGKIDFYFNIPLLIQEHPDTEAIMKKEMGNKIIIGYDKSKKEYVYYDINKQVVISNDESIIGTIGQLLPDTESKIFEGVSTGTKFIHSRAKVMKKWIPLVLFLAYCESLTGLLRIANIKYRFSDKRPTISRDERVIRFNDGYFIYTVDKFSTELLLNGLTTLETRGFKFSDFDSKDTYVEILYNKYGTRILGNALDNFYDALIDPKTKEILDYLNYPTDFTRVMLFANELLSDNSYKREGDLSQFRIRSFEMFPGMLYKAILDSYGAYRATASNNRPVKLSIPKDYLIKEILTLQIVEDYSELNPTVELEKNRTITPKGHSGLNLDRAYTINKRMYDPSMKGVYAIATSPDGNAGVQRVLSLEPNIKNIYGIIDLDKTDDEMKDVNLFSAGELLSPMGASSDDAIRTSMGLKQAKHQIVVTKSSPVLISNGIEETVPYHLSKDFCIVAEEDGKIIEITDKVAIAKYKSGKIQAIDLRPRIVKNSAGGFYLSNKYKLYFKLNESFKKNEVLAADDKYFTKSNANGVRMNIGSLQKVAIAPTGMTIEDSAEITTKMADDLKAEVLVRIPITVPRISNVDYICKKGQAVKTGDEIIRFDNSNADEDISKLLANIGKELQEEVISLSKHKIKSKVTGVIEDIKISSAVELGELSPTLKKIVSDHYKDNKEFVNTIDKNIADKSERLSQYRAGVFVKDTIGKVSPTAQGKIKGEVVDDGVLIEIFIKYDDYMAIGDKGAFFTALKFTVGDVIPEGYEPYSLLRPKEEVSSFIGTSAIIARKTPSITKTLAANKAIVELKRKLWEIYYGKKWNDR